MTITVTLPDDFGTHENPGREALEAVAIEGYRTGVLSRAEAALLLGLGRLPFSDFLHQHHVDVPEYGIEELLEDIRTGDLLRASGQMPG